MNLKQTPKDKFEAHMREVMQGVLADMNAGNKSGMTMTAAERKFFAEDIKTDVGTKDGKLLPEDTLNEVFDNLSQEHPFLATLQLQNTGMRFKVIKANTTGTAIWGDLFGDIQGQLDADFVTEDDMQNKLTSFVLLPKDMSDFGPDWIKKFVVTQITEAMASALEAGFIGGDGSNLPIGLMMDVSKGSITNGKTTYPKKAIIGNIDFSDHLKVHNAIAEIAQKLSMAENGKALPIDNTLSLAVNPHEYQILRGAFTTQNDAGIYVETYPLGIKLVPAIGVAEGEAVAYRASRYVAAVGGGLKIETFDQTFALQDMDLYTAKEYAYGKALDNNVSAIYSITLPSVVTGTTPETPGNGEEAKATKAKKG